MAFQDPDPSRDRRRSQVDVIGPSIADLVLGAWRKPEERQEPVGHSDRIGLSEQCSPIKVAPVDANEIRGGPSSGSERVVIGLV